MLLAARDARDVVAGLSLDAFEDNRTTQLAAAHALHFIGEAANRVSSKTLELHPEIPWRRAALADSTHPLGSEPWMYAALE